MKPLARWCFKHRFAVIALWIIVLVGLTLLQFSTGTKYSAGTSLSGTPSAAAANLLRSAAPSISGDTETIVFESHNGPITAPAAQATINQTLTSVSQLANVGQVSAPFGASGSKQISRDRRIAFATVDFTKDGNKIPQSEANSLVRTARASNSSTLQVEVVGSLAASTAPNSQTGTLVGIVAALIVLLLFFRAVLPALLPLVSTTLALFAALGAIGILSNNISMASFTVQLCELIGLGVGIDYSLFILARTRSGLRKGLTLPQAVEVASATSGRAVLFAGITVCIALLGMVTVGVGVLSGAAVAASLAVLFPMAAAQTLLPAFMSLSRRRLLSRKQRKELDQGVFLTEEPSKGWLRWARTVEAHKGTFAVGSFMLLLALSAPFLSMRQGSADYSTDPTSTNTTVHRGYELLAQGFGPGFSGPLQVVAAVNGRADVAAFDRVSAAVSHTPGVASVIGPQVLPAGPGHPAVAVADAYPTTSPQSAATATLIGQLRSQVIPPAAQGSNISVLVGGHTALASDFASQLSSKLPLFVGMIVLLSCLLLMVVFRSVAIPITAAVMNLLSAGAAFGVIVAVFQWGWLSSLVGVHQTGPIPPLVPILMFSVLFGLSMDYEVFLLSRMHEEWMRRRDNSSAVSVGLSINGKTITAAAAIMMVVFAGFVPTTDRTVKMIGLGMAVAIAIDSLIIRTMLVPAIMYLLGRRNWQLPDALERHLPHLDVDAERPADEAVLVDSRAALRHPFRSRHNPGERPNHPSPRGGGRTTSSSRSLPLISERTPAKDDPV